MHPLCESISTALLRYDIAIIYIFRFSPRKQYYRTAFNFLTTVHGRRPPISSGNFNCATVSRAGSSENRTCARAEPAPEYDIISRRRRRSSSPRRDSTVTCSRSEAHVHPISTLSGNFLTVITCATRSLDFAAVRATEYYSRYAFNAKYDFDALLIL